MEELLVLVYTSNTRFSWAQRKGWTYIVGADKAATYTTNVLVFLSNAAMANPL